MVFTSFKFLLFLSLCIAIYFIVPVKARGYVLLAFSLVFYCMASVKYLPFILGSTFVSFFASLYISNERRKTEETEDEEQEEQLRDQCNKRCKRAMLLALLFLLGALCYTKFGKMIASLAVGLAGGNADAVSIIVPLGISYYTFSTVGYVLDVYWERYDAERNLLHYMTYVMYFPHILQGPIARFDRLGVQMFQEHRFDYKRVTFGIQRIMWGFFQKLVIADRVSIFVKAVFDDYKDKSGPIMMVAALLYAVQIYTDFCGCVDIAKGISEIFDIELEDNFRQPYFSKSVAEYWRRWHITLGAWFKDYLCMPVAVAGWTKKQSQKARKKWGRVAGKNTVTLISLAAVWIATGVWHGTGLNYVIWGIWQGGIIAISTVLEPKYKIWKKQLHINEKGKLWGLFCIVRTFILTAIVPRIIVRSGSLHQAAVMFKRMLTQFSLKILWDGSLLDYGLDLKNLIVALIAIAVLFTISLLREHGVNIRESVAGWFIVPRWAMYYLLFFVILIFGIYGPGYDASSFVYMKF